MEGDFSADVFVVVVTLPKKKRSSATTNLRANHIDSNRSLSMTIHQRFGVFSISFAEPTFNHFTFSISCLIAKATISKMSRLYI